MNDFIDSLLTALVTIIGVVITVIFSRKDTNKTIKTSEKSSKDILFASVKPILCPMDKSSKYENTVIFKTNDDCETSDFTSVIKNTDNGIAIIKRITANGINYYPETDCVIDKGSSIKIILKAHNVSTINNTMDVYDIYNNLYPYTFIIKPYKFIFCCRQADISCLST